MLHAFLFIFAAIACSIKLPSGVVLEIPNIEVCADKGSFGAFCAWTRDGTDREIAKQAWDAERFGYYCMKPEGFVRFQEFIEKACASDSTCVDEAQAVMRAFGEKLDRFPR